MKRRSSIVTSYAVIIALFLSIAVSCNKNDGNDITPQSQLKAASSIVVRARGTNGTEQIRFTVAGATVATWTLTTTLQSLTTSTSSAGDMHVEFFNDAGGRDVQVDFIQVNGTTLQAENQATNTGSWNSATSSCGGVKSEWLFCNGFIDFGNLAASSTLSVSPTSLSVAAAAGSTSTFTVTSNTSWTASSSQTWLTVSPASSSNNGTVTVTAQQNTGSTRTATVTVAATGVPSQTVTVTQSGAGGSCTVPPMPAFSSLPANSFLPDPFTFMSGSRMTLKSDWDCRRAEIATLAQEFEYGYKQNTPYSATTGSFGSNTLTVNVTDNGKTMSFACSITYPSTGTAPYPALIGVGGSSLNNSALSGLGVAVITFPNDQIAQQVDGSSRGKGKFYDMYGSTHSAGALMAWAWGVDRLIDAIEKTPAANIDPTRLGVTGCSRNGKGALCVGAFDDRIKLTIPQESGSGGDGSWRVSDFMLANGQSTQTLSEIVGENVWFRANFNQFSSAATKLPFDHHSIIGLVAPRAVLCIENNILWLGPESSWNCANAAHMIWAALGIPDKMGYSEVGNHNHCAFPSSQQAIVSAYVQKFLVGNGTASTTIMQNDAGLTFDNTRWVNWTVPSLQ